MRPAKSESESMTGEVSNIYDEVLYPGYPFPQSHPDRLATLATLFGLNPAKIEDCRVLEIGCGEGANLIPMALQLPKSKFVGIDLAAQPIGRAQAMAEALELRNITFQQLDIMDLTAEFGQFDYVIAHGVYSWVPATVRDKLLAVCKASLAPGGIVYVSYNTYPGSHLRDMVREMMLFHIRDYSDPADRISQARDLARFLEETQSSVGHYKVFLESLRLELERTDDGPLYHDYLAETNSPVYFHQFIDHAAQHGLQYLTEADFFDTQEDTIAPNASETLRMIGSNDPIAKEQYLDFLTCRRFRQTLLCHQDVAIDRRLKPEPVMGLFVASCARPQSKEVAIDDGSVEVFQGTAAATFSTNHPLTIAAITRLSKIWPRSMHFNDLLTDPLRDDDALVLAGFLLKAYAANMVELHVRPSQFALEIGERPTASRLARLQLKNSKTVTTLRHTSVRVMDGMGRQLLMLLDGTRDRETLLKDLGRVAESDQPAFERNGKGARQTAEALKKSSDELEHNLVRLAQLALLVA